MKPSRFTERTDHRDLAGAGSRGEDGRRVSQTRDQQRDCQQMESQVWRARSVRCQATEGREDGNAKLKKLLAEAMLDNAMLKDVAAKKW